MLRRRHVNIKTIKEFDSFPKIREPYVERTAVGGTFSLLSFVIMLYLIIAETRYFLDGKLEFKFEPDTDIDAKLKLNIDITVAMPCGRVGADVLSSTDQSLIGYDSLEETDTWWDLSSEQRIYFDSLKHLNSHLREEYHAIHELLWKSNNMIMYNEMPKRPRDPEYPPDACRIQASFTVNKVAGNFHVTAGKPLSAPGRHIHIYGFMTEGDYNFTHRINRFSFGEPSPGIVHPLEGDEKIAGENMMLYQYFIEVVPTDIYMLLRTSKTYQYSVRDHQRPIDHDKGSHGIPGIFFKYDVSALKVNVIHQRETVGQFLVKLCATLGGVFVTSGLVNSVVQFFSYILLCKFFQRSGGEGSRGALANSSEQPVIAAGGLLNVSTPDNLNFVLNPQES